MSLNYAAVKSILKTPIQFPLNRILCEAPFLTRNEFFRLFLLAIKILIMVLLLLTFVLVRPSASNRKNSQLNFGQI